MRKVKFGQLFTSRAIDETLIREHLALERTKLANERTLLSYTQAALYFLLGGLTLLQLKEYQDLHYIGYLALGFSALFVTIGIWRFLALKRKMRDLLKGNVETSSPPTLESPPAPKGSPPTPKGGV